MFLTKTDIDEKLIIKKEAIKTFVFDLDGTIVYNGKPVDEKFNQLLLDIKDAGHQIIYATGRSFRDFIPVIPEWSVGEPSVVFGGGLVIANDEIKFQQFIDETYLHEIIEFLEKNHVHYLVDGQSNFYHPSKEHWLYQDIVKLTGKVKAESAHHVICDGAYKILILDFEWLSHFQQFIIDKALTIKCHFYDKCFDIMPANVNKYNGLSILSLPEANNIYVFGNDQNDLELMQNLPNSIMLGHHQELSKYAKIQIPYNDDLFTNFKTVINVILGK